MVKSIIHLSMVRIPHKVERTWSCFREAIVKTIRDFYKKPFDSRDVQTSVVAAISLKVEEPVFESQTKQDLGSQNMATRWHHDQVICLGFYENKSRQLSS
jgi:hypothetical protein